MILIMRRQRAGWVLLEIVKMKIVPAQRQLYEYPLTNSLYLLLSLPWFRFTNHGGEGSM